MIALKPPILVHSDAGRLSVELRRAGIRSKAEEVPLQLLSFLSRASSDGEDGLVFPAFNYDFARTRIFKVSEDPVQVGALPEWVRQSGRYERTAVPFFSVLHRGAVNVREQIDINPFGPESIFAELLRLDGAVLLAGVGVNRLTIIHFVEEMFGPPLYRYDKVFGGTIQTSLLKFECRVRMHVRPPIGLDYDWERIEAHLRGRGVLQQVEGLPGVMFAQVEQLVDCLGIAMSRDPAFLLTKESRDLLFSSGLDGAPRIRREDFERDS